MATEIKKLTITQEIVVGQQKIEVAQNPQEYKTEIIKYDNGSIAVRYTELATGIALTKAPIITEAKVIWQRAQQQQG